MKQFTTIFAARAVRESNEARAWLAEHRGADRVARLNDEVNEALDRLERFPEMGAPVRSRSSGPSVRRIILDRSGYHLYYRAHLESCLVEVICFWHEKRRPPKL